ncbi:TetR/AcrR family transcriptional regulator [Streptomyces sp. NPDC056987]|uniref:TetR/AcrR family transcriptional regulator n=1 Tax=Streptomyces sp. NPDC056987 TaxID=3345988 RepID=UPI00362E1E21
MSTVNAVGRRRNTRGEGSILRGELIEAAARLLAESERPESLTLRQVAREVGVAPASIYSHFADLGALIDHVVDLRYAELAALMTEADRAGTPIERLARHVATFVEWGVDHPGEYRTLFSGRVPVGVAAPVHHAGMELLDSMTDALAAAVDRGHAPVRDPASAGLLLWTAMHGLVTAYTEHPNVPWPPLSDLVVRLVALHADVADIEVQGSITEMSRWCPAPEIRR